MLINTQKQQQKQSISYVQNAMKQLHKAHQIPEFQHLIQMLHNLYIIYNAELQRDIQTPDKIDDLTFDIIRRKSQNIILKNQKLKQKILIIKARLTQLQNLSQPLNSVHYQQQRQYIQNIKIISTEIKTKLIALKEKRYLNKQSQNQDKNYSKKHSQNIFTQKSLPSSILSIQQMKKGTQFMTRSLIKTKYDIKITEKHIKMDNIISRKN